MGAAIQKVRDLVLVTLGTSVHKLEGHTNVCHRMCYFWLLTYLCPLCLKQLLSFVAFCVECIIHIFKANGNHWLCC